jgi:hypothetical protein
MYHDNYSSSSPRTHLLTRDKLLELALSHVVAAYPMIARSEWTYRALVLEDIDYALSALLYLRR